MTKEERKVYYQKYYLKNRERLQAWQRIYWRRYGKYKKKYPSQGREAIFLAEREVQKDAFTKRDLQGMPAEKFGQTATRIARNDAQLV